MTPNQQYKPTMNTAAFESVTFLNSSIKNKLLNRIMSFLEDYQSRLSNRGCDDLEDKSFSDAELVLLNMEYSKINNSIASDIEDGVFATKLCSQSQLVAVASKVLEQYIVDNAGYDDEN